MYYNNNIAKKNLFNLPEDIFHIVNKYEPNALTLFLTIKKSKIDNYVKIMKEDEYRYENLTNWAKKVNNMEFNNLQLKNGSNELDEAFYNYFQKVKTSLILPEKIQSEIKNNKRKITSGGKISDRLVIKIQRVCLHEKTREYKRFIYDECIERTRICTICNFELQDF